MSWPVQIAAGPCIRAPFGEHQCLRCAHRWWPRSPTRTLRCPRCKSPYWDCPRRPDPTRGTLPRWRRVQHRRINRDGLRNNRAPVLREGVGAASRAEGHGAELDGDGAGAPPAVRGALGQRPTEGPRPITTRVPCPPLPSGAGTNPSRGAGHVAAGRPGRPQKGWPDARGHRAATKETLAC